VSCLPYTYGRIGVVYRRQLQAQAAVPLVLVSRRLVVLVTASAIVSLVQLFLFYIFLLTVVVQIDDDD
jgi:hypothetical protein